MSKLTLHYKTEAERDFILRLLKPATEKVTLAPARGQHKRAYITLKPAVTKRPNINE